MTYTANSQHMISHCKWTIDCDSKIDDTRLKVDRAAKKIDGIDVDLVQLLLTAQPYKLCFLRVYFMTSTYRSPLYMHLPSIQGSPRHLPCRRRKAVRHRRSGGLPSYAPSQ